MLTPENLRVDEFNEHSKIRFVQTEKTERSNVVLGLQTRILWEHFWERCHVANQMELTNTV